MKMREPDHVWPRSFCNSLGLIENAAYYDDAILAYRQVVALSKGTPKNAALAYFNAGIIYLRFKKYAEAANASQQSILFDSSSAEAHNPGPISRVSKKV